MENKYEKKQTIFGEEIKHPAYGTIRLTRLRGGHDNALFGSSIKHNDTISLSINHASITRGLHEDSIYGNAPIVNVEMSYSQFAEAITSFGNASGVPCTIRYTEKDGKISDCDFVSKREQFIDEFSEAREKAVHDSQNLIKEVVELFSSKKTLTKADKTVILSKLNQLNVDISCNMDFIAEQFNNQMDKTISEAKGEIETFCQNKINSIAQQALVESRDDIFKLDKPVDID